MGEGAQVIGYCNRKACEMQSADTVLGVLRDRGRKGLPCNELYRQMFNRDLYLLAFFRTNLCPVSVRFCEFC